MKVIMRSVIVLSVFSRYFRQDEVFLCCDSQETAAGVNRMLIVCLIGFSCLTDVRLQEVFYSLVLPL